MSNVLTLKRDGAVAGAADSDFRREGPVQLVQQRQTFFCGTFRGSGSEPGFTIKLGQGQGAGIGIVRVLVSTPSGSHPDEESELPKTAVPCVESSGVGMGVGCHQIVQLEQSQ